MTLIGKAIFILAIMIYLLAGLIGLIITFGIVKQALGIVGAIIAIFLFPITLAFAPWYAGLVLDNWQPLLIIYGGGIVASAALALANWISGGKYPPA